MNWPIHPTTGRFTLETGSGGTVIAARNAARYAPFVALIESVDTGCAVALQRPLYLLWLKSKLAEIRKLVAAGS